MDFSSIRQELNSAELIENRIDLMTDDELEVSFNGFLGATVIQIQKVEYSMLGSITTLNEVLLKGDKNFTSLNPTRFFSNNPDDVKYRKQTLGTIISFLKTHVKFFNPTKLDEYLARRNDLIHNLWRKYLSHGRDKNRLDKIQAFRFVISVYKDSLKWSCIFKGFLYEIAMHIQKINKLNEPLSEKISSLQKYQKDFLDSIENPSEI